nr:hypothetical protein CFP56_09122 [Quercus suber]
MFPEPHSSIPRQIAGVLRVAELFGTDNDSLGSRAKSPGARMFHDLATKSIHGMVTGAMLQVVCELRRGKQSSRAELKLVHVRGGALICKLRSKLLLDTYILATSCAGDMTAWTKTLCASCIRGPRPDIGTVGQNNRNDGRECRETSQHPVHERRTTNTGTPHSGRGDQEAETLLPPPSHLKEVHDKAGANHCRGTALVLQPLEATTTLPSKARHVTSSISSLASPSI